MGNPIYTELASETLAILLEFGRDVTLRKNVAGVYDPATSGATASTPTDKVLRGAVFDFPAGRTTERADLIQKDDKRLILQAGTAPANEDQILIGGVAYRIVSFEEVAPDGTPVVYDMHLRK